MDLGFRWSTVDGRYSPAVVMHVSVDAQGEKPPAVDQERPSTVDRQPSAKK